MAETITYLSNYTQDASTEAVSASKTEIPQMKTLSSMREKVSRRARSGMDVTSIEEGNVNDDQNIPVKRIYPHVFDEEIEEGQARSNLLSALNDAQLAIEHFGEADLESVSTRLTLIASTMSNTHRVTEFNESLGAVVSFLRRAMLAASVVDITRSQLNALVYVLQNISANPMIVLNDAADLVEKLSDEGWEGEHGFSMKLLTALLDDVDTEFDETVQAELFEESWN